MIKLNELKVGDYVVADFEGQKREGIVTELNREDGEVCVESNVQSFWYKPDNLQPIQLNDRQLQKLGFEKETYDDGTVKYKKGPFRILLNASDDFTNFEMWYREDRRHITQPIAVHEFQHHYQQMTKMALTP